MDPPTSPGPKDPAYVHQLFLLVPGRLETLTGGYGYDRRIVEGLRQAGWQVSVVELDASFPRPTAPALDQAARELAAIPDETTVLIDGLALGAMPMEVGRERGRLRLVAVVHHPLAAETGIDRELARALEASERQALAAMRRVVVTSQATARALASYGVAPSRITVIEPGTDRAPLARGSGSAIVHLLTVGALIPRKGHETLIRALAPCRHRRWFLTMVGSLDRDPETTRRVRAIVSENDLADRVMFAGEADERALERFYDAADLFVLPTLHEGYGMAVAEALARGLPVISTATGAIGELVTRAGILVPPADPDALAAALLRVLDSTAVREELAAGARAARDGLPGWDEAVRKMAEALGAV